MLIEIVSEPDMRTAKEAVAVVPDSIWAKIANVAQSPKFLIVVILLLGGAWLAAWLIRRHKDKQEGANV